ncbi:MFS general substrate transporter, partial [Aureobasidium melanogenum]
MDKHGDTAKEEEIEYIDFKPQEPISGELDNDQADLYAEALRRYPNDESIDQADEKRLKRKLDTRILPLLGVCYFFYYVDKTTLSYAAIFGIKKDLKLTGEEYSWLSSIFYFGWLVWAIPSNLIMQRCRPGWYLSFNIFFWGALLMCQAAANNFPALAALRILSGAFEAIADPAFMLITSMYYTREEQPSRIAAWYVWNGVGVAGGGLIGYGIGNINGALASWRYEFLIGALVVIWIGLGAMANRYLPKNSRTIVCALFMLPTIAGALGFLLAPNNAYVGRLICFYLTGSYQASFVLSLSLVTSNTGGQSKKMIVSGMIWFGACVGNIASPFFYRQEQAPSYPLGIGSLLTANCIEFLLFGVLRYAFIWENKRKEKIRTRMRESGEAAALNDTAFSNLTDKQNPNFEYVY